MKMKPKKGAANVLQTQRINFPSKFKCDNIHIQETIEKLRVECTIDEQQKLLKTLPNYLKNEEDSVFVSSFLTYMFLTIDAKHPIRKTLSRILLSNITNEVVIKSLSINLLCLIENCKIGNESFVKRHEVVTYLQGCFNNFPPGIETISCIIDDVTNFTINFFVDCIDFLSDDYLNDDNKKSELYTYIYNITRLLVSILQQCTLSKTLPDYSTKLMLASYKVIMDDWISFDTKSNCGLLMVISVLHLPDHITNDSKFKTNPCLTLLNYEKTDDARGLFNFENIISNDTANICIYSGILNIVPHDILCQEIIDDVPVISFMFEKLLDTAKRCTGKPTQILEVSRTIILISRIMNTIPLFYVEPIFCQGLDYVWTHLDHFVDAVRHAAKTIFENLIKLAYRHYKDGYTALLKMILTNMIDLLVNRCTHYVALTILSEETGCSFLLEQFSHLPFILLINIADSTIAPHICSTYESLMAQHAKEEPNVDKWLELWIDLVKPLLTRSKPPVTTFYQRLLISGYKIQPLVLKSIMHYQWYSGANELGALLGCLRVARKSNITVPMENVVALSMNKIKNKFWRGFIEIDFLEQMMCHQADEVRVSVLALVVESQKSTEIFTSFELNFLKKYFHYNATTQQPNTRQQIVSLYKKAFVRIKEGRAVLTRNRALLCNKLKTADGDEKATALKELKVHNYREMGYKMFIEAFFREYLCSGLHAGCNFQRRATCLELILFVITENCVGGEEFEKIWHPVDTVNILQILCDTYESNINFASLIVRKMSMNLFEHFQSKEAIKVNIQTTLGLASDIKPCRAMSAGYILQLHILSPYAREAMMELLCCKVDIDDTLVVAITLLIQIIQMSLQVAKKNILTAAKKAPCYGLILCIRHLIEKEDFSKCNYWTYLISELVTLCNDVCHVVSPIVNNASPEGYLPMDNGVINTGETDETVTSQMVLVFAWRTVKEVSLLLGELVMKAPETDPKTGKELLTHDVLSKIGEHFLNLFLETKHRGAYEQAYVGFCKFCKKLWQSNKYNSWPKMWLSSILKILTGENQNTFHKLCPTRRSAGLPFMIQALLITEPQNTGNEHFRVCMKSLLNIAGDESDTSVKPRTHAMNILRALFRHNQLGELVAPYVAKGVMVAISGFDNELWGVRNAATLLFATLMIRMFGVHRTRDMDELSLKNRMSARVFFMRYAELYDFLLQRLIQGTEHNRENVNLQPVLLILERLYPCNTEEESQLGEYIPHVTKCLSNCTYKIRELAAQALTSLIPNLEVVRYISKILIQLSDVTITDNYCQGLLLQLMYLLKSLTKGYSPLQVSDFIEDTFWIFITVGRVVSHYTAALYLDVVVLLTTVFMKNCQGQPIFRKLSEILLLQAIKEGNCEEVLSTARKKFRTCRFNLHLHVITNLFHCDSYFKSLYIKTVVLNGLHSTQEDITEFCLNYINYLYFDSSKYVKHSLYLTDLLEISEREHKLVASMDPILKEYVLESIHRDLEMKLFPVFNQLLETNENCRIFLFLVLQHYPCILNKLQPKKQDILDFLLKWCRIEDDVMFCASLSAISTFVTNIHETDSQTLNYSALFKLVRDASSPSSTLHQRISVAQFLVANRRLICEKNTIIKGEHLAELWNTVLLLLEDDDQLVRDTISQLNVKDAKLSRSDPELPVISVRAREELLDIFAEVVPTKYSVPLLFMWATRHNSVNDESGSAELFDKGELNSFVEYEQLAKLSLKLIRKVLWKLEYDLNYEERSIFVEEHALMVATNVYNILYQNSPPLLSTDIRIILLCVIKKMIEFLESCPLNQPNFQPLLEQQLLKEMLCIKFKKCTNNFKRNMLPIVLKCIFNIETQLA